MVTSRAKRSTAGNRLKALLDQELEKDEVFAEVENDIDFEANENEDGVDIVDSDFDRDSDDDARVGADESEGEREIEAEERAEKQKRRAAARTAGTGRVPAVVQRAVRRPPTEDARQEAKRRRISFAPDQPSSSSSSQAAGSRRRRTSARSATVQSKREVESRLEETSQRRASLPARPVVKKKATLTQDALIAEALEVEEENRESLRRFLEQEEERRAKQRQRKERITGPFVRWMSVGLKTKVVEEVKEVKERKDVVEEEVPPEGTDVDRAQTVEQSQWTEGKDEPATARKGDGPEVPPSTKPSEESQSMGAAEHAGKPIVDDDVAMNEASHESPAANHVDPPAPTSALTAAAATSIPTHEAPAQPSSTTAPSTQPSPTPQTNASLTLDPVIAARQQASLLRTSNTPSKPLSTPSSSRYEMQARTLLSVERMPEDWEWLDEFNALLGTHCDWSSYPFVPSRNRPLKPRQSICPITGLPAVYKDPRTGVPYANADAYKVLTRLLEGGFVWSGGHYEESVGEGEGRKRKEKGKGKAAGAVPIEMGVYLDDEAEKGPGRVWNTARETRPTLTSTTSQAAPSETPSRTPTTNKPAQSRDNTTATTTESPAQEPPRKKQKPGFEVVLTNAIAPGDEKSVLAAALSLPAGSTRSGRRVQRS